ncbi:MAG TPA: hypothetical protein VLA82_11195 [Actinomycetota bacterium]|nr:hypothetical protein [Actinomycetota bacterium]
MGRGDVALSDPLSFRAYLERFPASIKGAFVLRAADGDPHQLRLDAARIADLSGGPARAMDIDASVLDVAPTLDTFVPFEFPITELPSGWYRLECDVAIDGVPRVMRPGEPFAIPWPRAAVRKGTVAIGAVAGDVRLVQLACGGDAVRVTYEAEREPQVRLETDGLALPVIAVEHDDEASAGAIVGFPALRASERLTIVVKGARPVDVALP